MQPERATAPRPSLVSKHASTGHHGQRFILGYKAMVISLATCNYSDARVQFAVCTSEWNFSCNHASAAARLDPAGHAY